MSQTIKLTILTPEKKFYKGQVKSIKTSNLEGPFQILPKHMALTTILVPAVTEFIDEEGKNLKAFTSSGIMRIKNNQVEMLCDACEWPEDIDLKRAQEALFRAEKRLKDHNEEIDTKRAEIALARALTRLKLTK
ncbi:F0F1 ATP synthase subunit epsilon [Clostridium thermarum]|uniref:F0F1 ATP synthase subunit epsilon n=1 Tax=Clostridium thermarum TaxID=1716543 RepID=UPI0013D56B5A|nr:F0F1 ATP synthase subunit epsilon [Clostridium thermarum]